MYIIRLKEEQILYQDYQESSPQNTENKSHHDTNFFITGCTIGCHDILLSN